MLDSMLSDGTGADFLRFMEDFLAEKFPGGEWPAIVSMSGNTIAEQKEMYMNFEHVDEFLQKPIKKQDLISIIQSLRR